MKSAAASPRAPTASVALDGTLAALVVAGVAAGVWRFTAGLGATTRLSDGHPWGLWIGLDFTLIAFSAGAFTLAAAAHLLRLERYRPLVRPVLLTGWLGYLAVLAILVVDLGRPDRFWAFAVYPNLHSPLYEVSWCVALYTVVLTLELAPSFLGRDRWPRVRRVLERVGLPVVVLGVTLSVLHQSTLGTLYLAMPVRLDPLWYTPILPVLYLVSSVGMGLSTGILVGLACGASFGRPVAPSVLAGLARASAVVWGVYLLLVAGSVAAEGDVGRALAGDGPSRAFLLETAAGVVAPILLFASPRARASPRALLAGALLAAGGVALNRFDALLTAQATPPGSSYVPHPLEIAIQVGVLAAALWAWRFVARRFPILPPPRPAAASRRREAAVGSESRSRA